MLAVQTVGVVWWAATISGDVKSNSKQIAKNEQAIDDSGSVETRLVRVESDLGHILAAVDDHKVSLQTLNDKLTELLIAPRPSPTAR